MNQGWTNGKKSKSGRDGAAQPANHTAHLAFSVTSWLCKIAFNDAVKSALASVSARYHCKQVHQ